VAYVAPLPAAPASPRVHAAASAGPSSPGRGRRLSTSSLASSASGAPPPYAFSRGVASPDRIASLLGATPALVSPRPSGPLASPPAAGTASASLAAEVAGLRSSTARLLVEVDALTTIARRRHSAKARARPCAETTPHARRLRHRARRRALC
jgi:hypothetical protein